MHAWGDKVDHCWDRIGVQTHPGKAINTYEFEEVQGAMVDSDAPAMSLSAEKEALLLRGTLRSAAAFRPARVSVERTLGKHGHAHSFRPSLRSICGEVYPCVRDAWENNKARVDMNHDCMIDLALLSLALPFARVDFTLPWCPRVEASGASPGGHGRAYMHTDIDAVQSWATLAAHRGDYTTYASGKGRATGSACRVVLRAVGRLSYCRQILLAHSAAAGGDPPHFRGRVPRLQLECWVSYSSCR